jgi:exoribonuclease II
MDPRYPIGEFKFAGPLTNDERQALIDTIEETPARMRAAVAGLNDEQLDTPYRPGGWTIRQVVHHLPESHMNSYIRFKLAITEAEPTIKPYFEGLARCVAQALGVVSAVVEGGRLRPHILSSGIRDHEP